VTSPVTSTPSDHYLNLDGARLMPTRATRATQGSLETVISAQAMMCIHGAVGLGKTLAVNTNLRDLAPDSTVRLELRHGSTLTRFQTMLFRALDLPGEKPSDTGDLEDLLVQALSDQPKVLLLDEAQGLTTKAMEFVRYLWRLKQTRLAVVFVGGEDCYRRIRSRAALASRICVWQQYCPLASDEVLALMPEYHQIWADVSPQDLLWVNDLICHGNFRNWAKATFHLQNALRKNPAHQGFTRDLMRTVLTELDSTARSKDIAPQDGYL
jgi:hypothetical protein